MFKFEHGTTVLAKDPYRAYEVLNSVSIKNVSDVENIGNNTWVVNFGKDVFIELQAASKKRAQQVAEWFAYLDRREMKIVS